MRSFSLSYISGSPAGLEFAAKHPHKLQSDLVNQLNNLRAAPRPRTLPRALPRIQAIQAHYESGPFDVDNATKPSATEQIVEQNATSRRIISLIEQEANPSAVSDFHIPESDDDDVDFNTKSSAMVATKPRFQFTESDDDDVDFNTKPLAMVATKPRFQFTESDDDDVDFNTKPSAMVATKPRFHIPEDDDADATEPSAMLDTKQPAQHQPMSNRTNDYGTEPPAKRQRILHNDWAPEPTTTKKPKTSKKSKTSGTQLTLRFGQTMIPKKSVSTKKKAV